MFVVVSKKTLYFVIKDRLVAEVPKANKILRESISKFKDEEENRFFGGVVFYSPFVDWLEHKLDKWL